MLEVVEGVLERFEVLLGFKLGTMNLDRGPVSFITQTIRLFISLRNIKIKVKVK